MIKRIRNDVLDLFATYKVFDVPDGLIDSLTFYTEHQITLERDRIFKMFVDEIDSIRERRNEGN